MNPARWALLCVALSRTARCGTHFQVREAHSIALQRVRISNGADIHRLYPLISAYVARPSLAESVSEIVISGDRWPSGYESCYAAVSEVDDGPVLEQEHMDKAVRDDAHLAIEAHVRGLGLGSAATDVMLRSLEWQKRRLVLDGGQPASHQHQLDDEYRGFASAAAVLLLSLCKNLSTAYVSGLDRGIHSPLREYLLQANYGLLPSPGLQNLKQVEILTGQAPLDDERIYATVEFLDYFQYFHRLPAIHSIITDGAGEYQANREFFVPRTGNMKKIHMGHADISSSLFTTIISIPKALEDVKLSLGGLWSIDGGEPFFIPGTLGRALLEYRTTLRVLDLDIDSALWYDMPAEEDDGEVYSGYDAEGAAWVQRDMEEAYGLEYLRMDKELGAPASASPESPDKREYGHTIGSLHDFDALTHLSIGVEALLGSPSWSSDNQPTLARQPPFRLIDALPPGLEHLCLYGYTKGRNADVDSHVAELMERRAERLPRLREVKGVDERVDGMSPAMRSDEEEELWQPPKRDLDWKDV